MNETKKPAIRFKEFMDAWEQRKIGECFSERIESFPEGELLSVTINSGVRKFCELGRNDNSNDDKSKYKKVCIGDIAYNSMRMWQGASGYSPYIGIVSPAYTVLSPKPSIDSKCLAYQLKLPSIIHTFQVNSQGITSDNWNLKYPSLSKIDIIISPDKKEQEQISHFFSNIDTTIAAYQSRFEKLQSLKSAMLEKMFPKDGANVPEIRFKGFNEAWKEYSFRNITYSSGIKNKDNLSYESYSITNNSGFVPQNEKFENGGTMKDADKRMYIIVEPHSFAYNPARINVGSIGYQHLDYNVIVSSLYEVFKTTDDCDDQFLWYWFKTSAFSKMIEQLQEGGVRLYFYYDKLCMCSLKLPNIEEQIKIAQYFKNLDILIFSCNKQLEKLQSIKKALLEKMFV